MSRRRRRKNELDEEKEEKRDESMFGVNSWVMLGILIPISTAVAYKILSMTSIVFEAITKIGDFRIYFNQGGSLYSSKKFNFTSQDVSKLENVNGKLYEVNTKKCSKTDLANMFHSIKTDKIEYPSKIMSFFANKGGVGKTTMSLNFADEIYFHHDGSNWPKSVILIDFDTQMNLSNFVIDPKEYEEVMSKIKQEAEKLNNYVETNEVCDNLSTALNICSRYRMVEIKSRKLLGTNVEILIGSPDLLKYEYVISNALMTNTNSNYIDGLNIFLNHLKNRYDLVVLDLNPGMSWLNMQLLKNSDFIIVPTLLDVFSKLSFYGLRQMFKIGKIPNEKLIGFVANRVKQQVGKLDDAYLEQMIAQEKECKSINSTSMYFGFLRDLFKDNIEMQNERTTIRRHLIKSKSYKKEVIEEIESIAENIKFEMIIRMNPKDDKMDI